MMTARQAAGGAVGKAKYYLCERSIKEKLRRDLQALDILSHTFPVSLIPIEGLFHSESSLYLFSEIFPHIFLWIYRLSAFLIFLHLLQKIDAWETEKTAADMEEYSWEDSPSQRNILDMLGRTVREEEGVREELLGRREVQEYRDSVTRLKNEGENEATMAQYKEAVKKVLTL